MLAARQLLKVVVCGLLAMAGCQNGGTSTVPTQPAQVRFVTPTRPMPSPTVAPTEEMATPTADGWQEYTVQPGDNLWAISQKYGLTVQDLVKANNIRDPNRLSVGQKLRIPPKPTPTPAP